MDVISTLEAINFQVNSKLAKGLTNLFQDVLDYKNTGLSYDGIPIDRLREYRNENISSFFKKTTIPKIKTLVKSETGITLKDIVTYSGTDIGVSMYFAIDISFDQYTAAVETIERSTASGNSVKSADREIVNDMRSMAEALSIKTGKMSRDTFGKVEAAATMYFDINAAFLMHDFLGNKVTEEFTAGEIAAIVMHEIGHVVTMCEHSGDLFAVSGRMHNLIPRIKKITDPVAFLNTLSNDLVPTIKKMSKVISDDPDSTKHIKSVGASLITRLETMTKFSNQYYAEYEADNETWLSTLGKSILNLWCMWIVSWIQAWTGYVMLLFQYHILDEMIRSCLFNNTNVEGGKASDIMATYNNSFLLERRADEYVSRHGYSAQLAHGLNKLYLAMPYLSLPQMTSMRLNRSTVWNIFLWMYRFSNRWGVYYAGVDPMGYENQYQRNRRILRNSYAAFRQSNVPKGLFTSWIVNTEQCEAAMKDSYVFVSNSDFSKALRNTFFNITNPMEWIRMLKHGKLIRDIEILDNRLDDMRNNELYYLSAKFGV